MNRTPALLVAFALLLALAAPLVGCAWDDGCAGGCDGCSDCPCCGIVAGPAVVPTLAKPLAAGAAAELPGPATASRASSPPDHVPLRAAA